MSFTLQIPQKALNGRCEFSFESLKSFHENWKMCTLIRVMNLIKERAFNN